MFEKGSVINVPKQICRGIGTDITAGFVIFIIKINKLWMFHMKHFSDDIIKMLEVLDGWGVSLSGEVLNTFLVYKDFLLRWNRKKHLISKSDEDKIVTKHFTESLALLNVIDFYEKKRLLDLGAGAGFPSVPLKILFPEIELFLVESNNKKSLYLKELIDFLGLVDVTIICNRAENLKDDSRLVKYFDIVTARAVASIDKVLLWSLPFLKDVDNNGRGGVLVAPSYMDSEIVFKDENTKNMVMREIIVNLGSEKKIKFSLFTKGHII